MGCDHKNKAEGHAHDRRDDDEDECLVPAFGNDDGEHSCGASVNRSVHHGGAGVSANQRMGRGGGQTPPPGEEIPDDSAEECGQDHILIYGIETDHALADGLGDSSAEKKRGKKVEGGGPGDR